MEFGLYTFVLRVEVWGRGVERGVEGVESFTEVTVMGNVISNLVLEPR